MYRYMKTLPGWLGLLAMIALMPSPSAAEEAKKDKPAKPEVKAEKAPEAQPAVPAGDVPKAKDENHPIVKMETSLGDIYLELDAEKAPISTHNFLTYAKEDYYVGTIFHRVIPNFMIQGGGMTTEMNEKLAGQREPIKNEWQNGLKNKVGTIAMARTQAPDSATSQFFINVVDNDMLDQARGGAAYAVFGKVVKGMDVVEKIRTTKCVVHEKYPSPEPVVPETPILIKSVKIVGEFDLAKLEKKMNEAKEAKNKEVEKQMQGVIKKFEDKFKAKFTTTPTGLMILHAKEGQGESPSPSQEVEVNYEGTLLNGTNFDSSYDRGQSIKFMLNQVIAGWTEGVGMMKPGGKAVLICPPDLAYGKRGAPPVIQPNSTLVFVVELIAVK